MRIGFKVSALTPSVASVWYRALYPALHLEALGHEVELFDRPPSDRRLRRLDRLIIVKSFGTGDVSLARGARRLGVPVLLDICDNVLLPAFGRGEGQEAAALRSMAEEASAVVVTGPALAEALRPAVPEKTPLLVIGDPIENEADNAAVFERLQRTFRMSRLRRASPFALPRLLGFALRRRVRDLIARARGVDPRPPEPPPSGDRLLPAAPSTRPADGEPPPKTVIWFGHHGAPHGSFGLSDLLIAAPHLSRVAADVPLRLLVVSGSEERFREVTSGFPFPCEYRTWSRQTIFRDLAEADLCIVPNSRDPFSLCKSANRPVLALSRGLPVVATGTPATEALRPFVVLDDWEEGLRAYLTDPARGARDVAAGRAFIDEHFAPRRLARRWEEVLTAARAPAF